MKVLLITFSDNADHQDITFGMFASLYGARPDVDVWVMGIREPRVPMPDTPHTIRVDCPKRPGIEKKTFDLKTLSAVVRRIEHERFDVIFFETLHVWNLAIMQRCRKHARVFQMIHDLIPHEGDRQAKSVELMNRAVCRMADDIVLCNRKYLGAVTERYGVAPERVHFVDLWRRFPAYSAPRHTGRALFFGRMNPYKGADNLLQIARMCPEIAFDVVGRVDPLVADVAAQLETLSNVRMNTGYVSDEEMSEVFLGADWVVLPYHSATQSGVVIDGYRFGRPCIAFDVGAVSEQVREGVSGFLVPAGDNAAFAEALRRAVAMEPAAYDALSRSAYAFGSEKYAAQGAVGRFLALIGCTEASNVKGASK